MVKMRNMHGANAFLFGELEKELDAAKSVFEVGRAEDHVWIAARVLEHVATMKKYSQNGWTTNIVDNHSWMPVGDLKNIDVKMLFRLVQVWWLMKKNDECPQMINQEELESYLGLRGKKVGGTLHEFVAKSKIGHYANLYIQTGMVNNWAQLEKAAQKGRNENAQDCKEKTSQAIHSMRKNIVQKKEASQSRIPRTG